MKKTTLLLAAAWMLLLWFVPERAQATLDVSGNLTQPFTIETTPATNSYIRFRRDWGSSGSTKVTINLQYRKQENGGAWGDWTPIATASTTTVAQLYGNYIALTAGTTYKIQFRGINSSGFSTASVNGNGTSNNYNITLESSSYTWSATMYGNIMSLIVGYDTDNETAAQEALAAANEIKSNYCFAGLFYDNNSGSTYPPAINAENLIFPAVYLREGCYRNLFYQYDRSDASFKGGLNEGPCFLATNWNNLSGSHVNNTFLNVFNQCANLKLAHFSFTSCPTSDDFNSYSVYGTPGDCSICSTSSPTKTLYAPAGFNPSSCSIGNWNGGHTVWSYDPSAEPVEPHTPEAAEVDIYQSGFKRGTKLLYPLTPTTVGGITYTPVDMGAGVAWADRNVGAENPEDAGTNFYWGDISGEESFSSAVGDNKYYTQARNMTSQTSILPLEYDAAYKTLGANWRMPTKQEMGTLWNFYFYPPGDSNIGGVNKNYFIQQSYDENKGITCTYQFEPEKTILIPFSYEYSPENQSSSKNIRFWTSLVGNLPNNSYSSPQNIPAVVYSGTSDGGGWNSTKISHGLPVRPVYVPTCETCTLKIGIQASGRYCILYGNDGTCWEDEAGTITYWFDYICEKGQQVTVNPIGNTGYVFDQWKASNNSTVVNVPGNVFTVTENATYYATFREQGWNITWNNYDGTELAVTDTRAGSIPEYTGTTPTKPAPGDVDWKYVHSGWTPALVAATGDATYTATFSQGYTLSTETGGKGTVTLTASGYPDRIGSGDYATGTSVTMTATPNDGAGFVRWSDNGSTNPVRTVEVNGNVTYTAVFGLESPDASVDVYENASVDKTKILHSLNPTTVGEITYNPIDLGYGVAWADKNVGAATENAAGNYFTWGKTTPITRYGVYGNIANVDVGYILSATEDAATVNIGDTWRMPTNSEWQALLNNTNVSGTTTFINKTDENLSITLPLSGAYLGYNSISYQNTYGYYWGSELMSKYYESYYYNWNPYEESGASLFTTHGGSAYYINTGSLYMATPIRAIYQPKYNVKTLTIIANGHNYVYKCQEGQSVTVTANATTEGHVFDKWTEDDNTQATRTFVMTDNITRTATFKEAPTGSTINIVTDNTGYGSVDVATINNVPDNSPITVNNNTLTINKTTVTATVTESNTAQYTYSFAGWTDNSGNALPATITEDLTIRANFTRTLNTYTVTWKNGEDVIETDTDVPYGETPSYNGETPTKDEDAENTYTFDAWSPAITAVAGNATYTATFTATPKPAELHIVLEEAEDDDYYNDFANHQGKTANTVTLNRQFTQGRWSTLCLPFEVSGGMMTTLKMSGRVYEFKYATGNANVGSGVNLYFSNAKKMEAGKGYIVNADAKLAEKTSFVFSNVTIDVTADKVKPLNSKEAYDNLSNANGYKTKGNIELVGTLRNGTLKGSDTGNTYMGLKSNKIYYPNISQGSTIWAYRGIFRSTETLNIEKMRIIVDGEDMGEIIIDADGDVRAPSDAPSRKFIRDGVLYIEREGVVYDAQGKRVEGAF